MTDELVAYVSDQAHSSLARAARDLGFRPDQVRVLPVDGDFRLRPDRSRPRWTPTSRAGRRPLFVSATGGGDEHRRGRPAAGDRRPSAASAASGCTSTRRTAASPCSTRGGREQLAGIELADSITLDPHKWLYQPYECGCLLVRDGELAPQRVRDHAGLPAGRRALDARGQLLRPRHAAQPLVRAFKVWLSLQYFGLDAFRRRSSRNLDLAEHAARTHRGQRRARARCRRRRSGSSASGGVFADGDEETRLNTRLVSALEESGSGSCRPRGCAAATRSGCACSATRPARSTSTACSTSSRRPTCAAPTRGPSRPTSATPT